MLFKLSLRMSSFQRQVYGELLKEALALLMVSYPRYAGTSAWPLSGNPSIIVPLISHKGQVQTTPLLLQELTSST